MSQQLLLLLLMVLVLLLVMLLLVMLLPLVALLRLRFVVVPAPRPHPMNPIRHCRKGVKPPAAAALFAMGFAEAPRRQAGCAAAAGGFTPFRR